MRLNSPQESSSLRRTPSENGHLELVPAVEISHPDLLSTKPKARSGQVIKFTFYDWLDCEEET